MLEKYHDENGYLLYGSNERDDNSGRIQGG